ncbi:hypothetical protein KI387_012261, partial [Taxus chinensis]
SGSLGKSCVPYTMLGPVHFDPARVKKLCLNEGFPILDRTHEDECLILANDGLWDVLSNVSACEVARKCLVGYRPHRSKGITEDTLVGVAAALLTKLALGRRSGDNISVVVINLKYNQHSARHSPRLCFFICKLWGSGGE